MPTDTKEIAELIRTQNNRITSHPIFCVQERYWTYDGEGERADIWRIVDVCFTQKGAEAVIAKYGYEMVNPRIYVASGYRNPEWQAMREMPAKLVAAEARIEELEERIEEVISVYSL